MTARMRHRADHRRVTARRRGVRHASVNDLRDERLVLGGQPEDGDLEERLEMHFA
jgi:hypothetical protein